MSVQHPLEVECGDPRTLVRGDDGRGFSKKTLFGRVPSNLCSKVLTRLAPLETKQKKKREREDQRKLGRNGQQFMDDFKILESSNLDE